MRHPSTRRSLAAVVALAALAVTIAVSGFGIPGAVAPAGAQPTEPHWAADAEAGARWLASQLTDEGYIPDFNGDPSPSNTVQTALALAAAGEQEASFDAAVGWLEANAEALVAPDGGGDNPGALGYALLLVVAAGEDPDDFGGVDLVDRLGATLDGDGMYGGAVEGYDPTFSAVYNQSLAILGLVGNGEPVAPGAVAWLEDQQCREGSPEAALGGWQAYRADPAEEACVAPDPNTFVGPDTNSTALAVEALAALEGDPAESGDIAAGLDFLLSAQDEDGGFPYLTGSPVDTNSTALVIQAIVAAGEDPGAEPWIEDAPGPISALGAWQAFDTCDQAVEGSFESPYSGGFPDQLASQQAVWGASLTAFPLPEVTFAPDDLAPVDVAAVGQPLQALGAWAIPPDAAEPVTGYEVYDGEDLAVVTGPEVCSAAVIGLEADSTHTFTVVALYDEGASGHSAPSDEVTILPASEEFSDVPPEQAFAAEINWAIVEGITEGYTDGTFLPAADVSRQAMAAFLYRFAGEPAYEPPAEPTFSDVPTDHAFYAEIEWLAQTGITEGYADGTFEPAAGTSRQAMAAFLYRFAGEPAYEPPAEPTFSDVPTDQGFYAEIEWLASTGISTGYGDDTFRPADDVTRQAMVAFLYRYTVELPVHAPPIPLEPPIVIDQAA